VGWLASGDDRRFHVHVQCAIDAFFGKELPETNCTIGDFQAVLDEVTASVSGRSLEAVFGVDFEVPLSRVPKASIVHPLLGIETDTPGMSMRMSGSRFTVEDDSRVKVVEWRLRKLKDTIFTSVTGGAPHELNGEYLSDFVEAGESAFATLILAGKQARPNLEKSGA
jgi:hypothetical protein